MLKLTWKLIHLLATGTLDHFLNLLRPVFFFVFWKINCSDLNKEETKNGLRVLESSSVSILTFWASVRGLFEPLFCHNSSSTMQEYYLSCVVAGKPQFSDLFTPAFINYSLLSLYC